MPSDRLTPGSLPSRPRLRSSSDHRLEVTYEALKRAGPSGAGQRSTAAMTRRAVFRPVGEEGRRRVKVAERAKVVDRVKLEERFEAVDPFNAVERIKAVEVGET